MADSSGAVLALQALIYFASFVFLKVIESSRLDVYSSDAVPALQALIYFASFVF